MDNNQEEKTPVEDGAGVEDSPSSGANFTESKPSTTPDGAAEVKLPEDKSKKVNWKLISLVVAIIALLGIGAYFVMKLSKGEENTQTEVVKNEIPLLRVSLINGPLNELYYDVFNDGAVAVNNQMYEGLVAYENVNKIVPRLVDSWSNPDSETWVFTLKQNVVFHSGNPLTAEDVKFTLDNSETVNAGGLGSSIASVEVVNANTVKVVTDGPDPLLLGKLAGLWIIDSTTATDPVPAGTGPYVIKADSTPTENLVELTAFENYHDGTIYTKALQINQLENADAITAFNNQTIDVASALLSDSEQLNLPNMKTVTITDLGVAFMGVNYVEGTPLADLKVRQAIEKAIDPALIIEAQNVLGHSADQFVTKDIPGYNPDLARVPLDVAGAKQLLADAGYADGLSLAFSYADAANNGVFDSVKAQLAEIGITVTKDFYGNDVATFFDKVFAGDGELIFLNYSPDVLDASDTYGTLFSGTESVIRTSVGAQVAALLDQASSTLEEQERLTTLKSIADVLQAASASVPLYSRDSITGLADAYVVERDFPSGGSGFRYSQVYLP